MLKIPQIAPKFSNYLKIEKLFSVLLFVCIGYAAIESAAQKYVKPKIWGILRFGVFPLKRSRFKNYSFS